MREEERKRGREGERERGREGERDCIIVLWISAAHSTVLIINDALYLVVYTVIIIPITSVQNT